MICLCPPTGYIHSGTQLKYIIDFENTGTDTAFNISVYDTLSDNVDVKSLKILMASAPMNLAILKHGGHNIAKFDFPNINLPDSTHHGLCSGSVMFTINALNGLPNGTTIFNHAGIFFDYNPVVMTDTVENIIGIPSFATNLNQVSNVSIRPNPATDELKIVVDESYFSSYTITNEVGQLCLQGQINNNVKVDIKQLPTGLYLILLKGDFDTRVMKFVKM